MLRSPVTHFIEPSYKCYVPPYTVQIPLPKTSESPPYTPHYTSQKALSTHLKTNLCIPNKEVPSHLRKFSIYSFECPSDTPQPMLLKSESLPTYLKDTCLHNSGKTLYSQVHLHMQFRVPSLFTSSDFLNTSKSCREHNTGYCPPQLFEQFLNTWNCPLNKHQQGLHNLRKPSIQT